MPILDANNIPTEIKEQIEAASFDSAKGLIWGVTGLQPQDTSPALQQLAQGIERSLTAVAMMVLPE